MAAGKWPLALRRNKIELLVPEHSENPSSCGTIRLYRGYYVSIKVFRFCLVPKTSGHLSAAILQGP